MFGEPKKNRTSGKILTKNVRIPKNCQNVRILTENVRILTENVRIRTQNVRNLIQNVRNFH